MDLFFVAQMIKKISQREAKYQAVVRNLVKRYVTNMQRTQQAEGVSEDDVNEIKQDISAFRYELLHILQQSGMNTSSAISKKGEIKCNQSPVTHVLGSCFNSPFQVLPCRRQIRSSNRNALKSGNVPSIPTRFIC